MTNPFRGSFKQTGLETDSEFEETPEELQNKGRRPSLLNHLVCLNTESNKTFIKVQDGSVTLKQLIGATLRFSPKMQIGSGSLGCVYKAELPNQSVAVKKLSRLSLEEEDRIRNEVFFLMTLRHENVIQLLDRYSNGALNILVYEYMERGSLYQCLFDRSYAIELDWKARFEICFGIAKGLKYLHSKDIIHGNINSKNVLLDRNLEPKISDPGWAANFQRDDNSDPYRSYLPAKTYSRVFIAPEYFLGRSVTDKADVYSYGVVALEVFSGRPTFEHKPNHLVAYLLDDARILHAKGLLSNLVDCRMETYDTKEAFTVLNLAIMCTDARPDLRPTISEVVSVLSGEATLDGIRKPVFNS